MPRRDLLRRHDFRKPDEFAPLIQMSPMGTGFRHVFHSVYRPPSTVKSTIVPLTVEPLCRCSDGQTHLRPPAGASVEHYQRNHIHLMREHELTLEGRLRAILRDVQDGLYSNEDATLRLRGEVLSGFFRGVEAQKKRPGGRR